MMQKPTLLVPKALVVEGEYKLSAATAEANQLQEEMLNNTCIPDGHDDERGLNTPPSSDNCVLL